MTKFAAVVIMVILFISCNRGVNPGKDELFEVEKAFSAMSEEKGMVAAFTHFCDEEGVLLRPNNFPIVGKTAVSEVLENTSDSLFSLTWIPSEARISKSGDLGYTFGIYTLSFNDTLIPAQKGTYVTIWHKDEKEQWRFVLDTGQQGLE